MKQANANVKGKKLKWASMLISLYFSFSVVGYASYYATDRIGLNVGVVGILFLVAKIVDAITNFIAATIVDNCHSKKGKGRPFAINIIPMWLCIVLMFSIPASWGTTAKYALLFLFYTLINAVFVTILQCIEAIYLKHAFLEDEDRTVMQTIAAGLGSVSMIIAGVVLPILIGIFDEMPHGWTLMTLLIAVPMALIGSIRYFTIPEVDIALTSTKTDHITIVDTIKAFFTNKYTIIGMLICMCVQISNMIASAPMTYYFKYIVGDISLASVANIMALPAMLILLFMTKLADKFGRLNVMRAFAVIATAAFFLRFLAGKSVVLMAGSCLLSNMGLLPVTVFLNLLLIDSMEYDRWKNHRNLEGAVFAGTSLGTTVGMGVGTSVGGLLLNAFGYDGNLAVQSASAIFGIKACVSFIPGLFMAFIVILLLLFDLDKKMPKIRAELAERDKLEAQNVQEG